MKTAAYGISTVSLATPGTSGAYPTGWTGDGTFSFKAIVKDSVSFNDSESSDTDIEVEDMDDVYATLQSSVGSKGFTMDTYDLGEDAYIALQGFSKPTTDNTDGWVIAPAKVEDLIKAVQIVTRAIDEFPSRTFQWAKMKIKVTRAGTIGKSGFPNFHLTFRELANTDASGNVISGHRWKINAEASATPATPATPGATG